MIFFFEWEFKCCLPTDKQAIYQCGFLFLFSWYRWQFNGLCMDICMQ